MGKESNTVSTASAVHNVNDLLLPGRGDLQSGCTRVNSAVENSNNDFTAVKGRVVLEKSQGSRLVLFLFFFKQKKDTGREEQEE